MNKIWLQWLVILKSGANIKFKSFYIGNESLKWIAEDNYKRLTEEKGDFVRFSDCTYFKRKEVIGLIITKDKGDTNGNT